MKKKKEPLRPLWTTTVHPDEYDYFEQFSTMVEIANENKETFCSMDVGKVWGLVLAYKELKKNYESLDAEFDNRL